MINHEQILSPGTNTPLSYQALLVSLTRLTKTISHECFLEPAHVGGRLPISRVTRSLTSLRRWYSKLPSHLQWDSSLHPQHRRAVSLLHLRFQAAIISLTRPFVLFIAARSTDSMIPAKRSLYEQISNTCIEAAEAAVKIIRCMRDDHTLSSLVLFDCHSIGEVIGILIMALQELGGTEHQAMLQSCVDTFRAMERIGWCERLFPEVETTVQESGVLHSRTMQPTQPPRPPELGPSVVGTARQFTGGSELASLSDYPEL